MDFFADYILIILLLPLLCFFIILTGILFKLKQSNKINFFLSSLSTIIGLLFLFALLKGISNPSEFYIVKNFFPNINFGVALNSLSIIFASVFLLISLIIQIYSHGFMKNKENYNICLLGQSIYNFLFLGLILAPNFIQFLIFEILGLISVYYFIKFFSKQDNPLYPLVNSTCIILCFFYFLMKFRSLFPEVCLKYVLAAGIIISLFCTIYSVFKTNLKEKITSITVSLLCLLLIPVYYDNISLYMVYSVVIMFTSALAGVVTENIKQIFDTYDTGKISGLNKTDYFLTSYLLVATLSFSGIFLGGFTSREILMNTIKVNSGLFLLFAVLLIYFFNTYSVFRSFFKMNKGEIVVKECKLNTFMTIATGALCIFVILPGFMVNLANINITSIFSILICIFSVIGAYCDNKAEIPPQRMVISVSVIAVIALIIISIMK